MNDDLSIRVTALVGALAVVPDLAQRSAESAKNFDVWARGYDARNHPAHYLSPARLASLAQTHLPPGCGPILDLACGTGLLGARLQALGFSDLTGVDISAAMLACAADKAVYRTLLHADLQDVLPFGPGSFAAVTSMGAFYEDSIEVTALAHALPLIRAGGHLICDIEMAAWQDRGYRMVLETLASEGLLDLLVVAPGQIFRPGTLKPDSDAEGAEGVFVVARIARLD